VTTDNDTDAHAGPKPTAGPAWVPRGLLVLETFHRGWVVSCRECRREIPDTGQPPVALPPAPAPGHIGPDSAHGQAEASTRALAHLIEAHPGVSGTLPITVHPVPQAVRPLLEAATRAGWDARLHYGDPSPVSDRGTVLTAMLWADHTDHGAVCVTVSWTTGDGSGQPAQRWAAWSIERFDSRLDDRLRFAVTPALLADVICDLPDTF